VGRLTGKVALIAGSSSGMGRATARRLAAEGAHVVAAARQAAALDELVAELREQGAQALAVPTDAADRAAVERLVRVAADHFGRIDVLVNSVGTNIPRRSLEVLTPADWEAMLATNVTAAFNLTQCVLPLMRQQGGGTIIHVSSGAVQRPDVSGVAYQASKHAVVGLAHGTMQEEKARGIRVTVIFPGLTDTPILQKRPTPTPADVLARAMQPDDVAEACLFAAALPPRAYVPELVILPAGIS
jgi:NAD(P)-dependent dehydrogenase (short-subunit alcohol dehydrogenase family)